MSALWQHTLLGCFDNFGLCVVAYCVPCYQFGKNAEVVGESCVGCGFLYLVPLANIVAAIQIRGKIREMKQIQGSVGEDAVAILFCTLCALVQEAQEVMPPPGTVAMARE